MKYYLQSHIVKKGETLEQIAEIYQVPDIEILKYFHYQNVPGNSNHLGSTLFAGQEIFVPDEKDIQEILFKRKRNLDERQHKDHSLIQNGLLLPNFHEINHTYTIDIRDIIEDKVNHTEFEILIQYQGKNELNYIFRLSKNNILLNGQKPDLKLHDLALECSSILSSAEVEINHKGKISDIHNYRKILDEWKSFKQNLQQKYEDELSLNYINEISEILQDREILLDYFRKDIFLQFYFSAYFKDYWGGKFGNESRFIYDEILYENKYTIEFEDEIIVKQESNCIDKRSLHEIFGDLKNSSQENLEDELPESNIKAEFYLDKSNKILQKAEVRIELLLYNLKEIKEMRINLK